MKFLRNFLLPEEMSELLIIFNLLRKEKKTGRWFTPTRIGLTYKVMMGETT